MFQVLTADRYEENKVIADHMDDLLKGLFKVLETVNSNTKTACMCLVNISAKENGPSKIIAFLNSDNSLNDLVYFASNREHIV